MFRYGIGIISVGKFSDTGSRCFLGRICSLQKYKRIIISERYRESAQKLEGAEILAMAFDNYCKIIGYETAIPVIKEWLKSDCANTRRAVSEGLRIWTSRPYFKEHPQMAIQFLSSLKDDESEYVRKSIGNALKDISKKYPELVSNELKQWDLSSKEIKQVHKLASAYLNKS